MKPIQLRKTVINIPFTDDKGNEVLTLHFDRSDESIKRLYDSFDKLKKQANKAGEDPSFEENEAFIKEAADSILGEGAFEKMHKLSPSIYILTIYLYQIAIGIKEELEEEDIKAVEAKYLE